MLLVIFGAGASHDSDPRRPGSGHEWRPPLTDWLFEDRSEYRDVVWHWPRLRPLLARLGQAGRGVSLEQTLAALQDEISHYSARQNDIATVRYYLQQLIWRSEQTWNHTAQGATNHLQLMDRIQRWRGNRENVVFATFNYDRFVERAATFYLSGNRQVDANAFDSMDSYLMHAHFPIIKLHGSVDWAHRVTSGPLKFADTNSIPVAHEVIENIAALEISPEIEKVSDGPPRYDGFARVPALAIPVDRKNRFVCPPSHIDYLKTKLPQVRSILAIGWRGMEEHFLELLRKHAPHDVTVMAVCGRGGGDETLKHLASAVDMLKAQPYQGTFSEFVVSGEIDSFLEKALAP